MARLRIPNFVFQLTDREVHALRSLEGANLSILNFLAVLFNPAPYSHASRGSHLNCSPGVIRGLKPGCSIS